ncbi:TonB-dependent receptor [uncultured Sphingomonas sp.]|uniref:TonB-dependent receptor domain-containing protein n=1 Tax=uncultured Sphingomonas sp. TaxID=158754 RepID=UPI0025CFD48F|nr:TonB-dependent receptor [uncultured Sphingomonas sp.]
MTNKFRLKLLSTSLLVTATLGSAPAFAQTTVNPQTTPDTASPSPEAATASPDTSSTAVADPTTTPDQATTAEQSRSDEIVVTGSRIVSPNVVSTSPITSVSATQLQATARVSVGDTLNQLPQLQSTFSQANSTRFLGTAGLNLLDLRGLGTQRTLVLVNGRRHVGSDILSNGVSVDVNTIPTDLIENVEVVTGGESAVYGSDAIAGVVNFKLKQDFEGLQVRGQGGVSQYGDAGSYFVSGLAGKNFADGRGNLAVSVEYARQNSLYASQRDYLRQNNAFVTVDTDPAGIAAGQTLPNFDGNPDNIFFRDVRSGTIGGGGLVTFNSPNGLCGADAAGRRFSCNYLFQPDGTLIQQTGTRVGVGTNGSSPSGSAFIGGNGDTRREGQLVQIQPQLDRFSANLLGHFEVSQAFVPFIEAKYSRTRVIGQGTSGPAFFTGATAGILFQQPTLSNPYLSDQARQTITNALIAGGTDPATINGDTTFVLRKNLVDLGVRTEESRRETYRVVGGVRGDFNGDWHYEVSGNYGEFRERTQVLGNLNIQRAGLALDAQRNAAGQIVCGSQLTPSRAGTDLAGNPAVLAADIAACQPYNPFGLGNASQATRDYLLQDTTSVGKITQFDVNAFMNGDTSGFFNLPGGPVSFVVGGEYRRETNKFTPDPLVSAGYTFYNALTPFNPPAFEVKEAYGEILLPILSNLPFAEKLSVTAAARVSDYNSSAGTVYTYNVGGSYSPIRDITFRANYARAVRAPNLTELYSPQGQNYELINDPCSANFIGTGTQYRAANCAAAGIPAGYNYLYQSSLEILSGGNPDLNVEKSDSYTYGVLLTPTAVPGLSLSVDYYNIKVNNVITAPSAQQILNSCYDAPTLSQNFCGLFQRVGAGQTGPNGEQAYRVIEGGLQQTLLNYAKLQTRGIDVNLAYSHNIGDVRLSSTLAYTHQLQNDAFIDPSQPGFADTILGEAPSPKDRVTWNINSDFGAVNLNYQIRYLSKQSVGAIEDLTTFQGRAPQNADVYDIPYYPDVLYMDARLGFDIEGGSQFYFGIDNLTNRVPPLGATGTTDGSGIFEPIGRRFYAGFTARF